MKWSIANLLLGLLIFVQSFGQVKDATQNMKAQADKMGQLFIGGDFKAFAHYTYPKILQMMGGADKMTEVLNKTAANIKSQGMAFNKITFDEPSVIVKSGSEMQATIAQHTELKLTQGRIVTTSTLIAISSDNGNNWTFVDTSNKDIVTLRKVLPNLSPSIIIPPPQQPVRYNN